MWKKCGWILLPVLVWFSGCAARSTAGGFARPPAPVSVTRVEQKPMPVQITSIGTVEPYSTVSVKSMVAGQIAAVHFKEGDYVEKGDLLFSLDPAPFQAALEKSEANLVKDQSLMKQAQANLARDAVQARNAARTAARYKKLYDEGYISREAYDQYTTGAAASGATVDADRAAVQSAKDALAVDRADIDNARIQLGYCSIRSPIGGRTGSLLIHAGNLVKANDTAAMITINQIKPIDVAFSVPQGWLSQIKQYRALGTLVLSASPAGDTRPPARGKITFIDNAVDQSTGTIRLKGTFVNPDRRLWPGEFVNVALVLTTQKNALVVPSQAVQTGQHGEYAFVVKPDMTAEIRPVTVARVMAGESVIAKGLKAGETVVTDGQLQIVPGGRVRIIRGAGKGG